MLHITTFNLFSTKDSNRKIFSYLHLIMSAGSFHSLLNTFGIEDTHNTHFIHRKNEIVQRMYNSMISFIIM